jgi:hypothetical protein
LLEVGSVKVEEHILITFEPKRIRLCLDGEFLLVVRLLGLA